MAGDGNDAWAEGLHRRPLTSCLATGFGVRLEDSCAGLVPLKLFQTPCALAASSLFGGLAVDEGPGPIECAALPPLDPGAALESDGSGVLLATPTTPGCPTAVPGAVDGAADAFELLDKAVPGCGSVWGQVPGPPLSLEEFQAMHDAEGG